MKLAISDRMDDLVHGHRRLLNIGVMKLPWPWPVAYALDSSSAMVLGCPVHAGSTPRYVKFLHRIFRRISQVKWQLMYRLHPRHRYHIIDTGLGYGYHERDTQLLHGAMACLIGYAADCEASGCHDPGDKARAILEWWRVTRPADKARYAQVMNELYGGRRLKIKAAVDVPPGEPDAEPDVAPAAVGSRRETRAALRAEMQTLDDKIRSDEQTYLHMLIDIRPGMWT